MDAITDRTVREVVLIKSSQTGGTEIILNTCGYYIDQNPLPMLVVQPTLEIVDEWSKNRLAPMLRDTPALRGKVRDPRSRDANNRIREKKYPGGRLAIAGANSPSSLAGRPCAIVLCDEVDRYPVSSGAEGDPILLARKRATTFGSSRKFLYVSSPTVKGASRIEAAYLRSDQRRYLVPCPACGTFQRLVWAGVRWDSGDPSSARYVCEACGSDITDAERRAAVRWGRWEATAESKGIAGFHISELYSPWVTLEEVVEAFLEAKNDPALLQVFINTVLGETWEESTAEAISEDALHARREAYGPEIPAAAVVLVASLDVQKDRLEGALYAYGRAEESWTLEPRIFRGDPDDLSSAGPWAAADAWLLAPRTHESGLDLSVAACAVDTGGASTQAAYRFCKERAHRRVWAIKGHQGAGRPVWPKRGTRRNKARVEVFVVGVDAARDVVYGRLQKTEPGPGYIHLPLEVDLEFCRQLTAERPVRKFVKGYSVRFWKQLRDRNEAWDLTVYGYVALCSLFSEGLSLEAESEKLEKLLDRPLPRPRPTKPEAPADPPPRAGAVKRRAGWMRRRSSYWRR